MWATFLAFLRGFIPAFISSWWSRRTKIKANQDRGAEDQREADRKADDAIVREAEAAAREIADAPDSDISRRLDRWRSPGGL